MSTRSIVELILIIRLSNVLIKTLISERELHLKYGILAKEERNEFVMNKDIELRKQIGERIRCIRNEMKLSKVALAKELGITGQFLGVVEGGKSIISYDKLKKLCDLTGYSADYILFGKKDKSVTETQKQLEEYSEEQIQDACDAIKKIAVFIKSKNN